MPARVDFYVVSDPRAGALERIACRLAETAWRKRHRVFVHTASASDAQRVDELLWTFRQASFVPHALYRGEVDPEVPVLVGDGRTPVEAGDVLINLTDSVPSFFAQFARIAEMVAPDAAAKRSGRERYRLYREHGCTIESHNV